MVAHRVNLLAQYNGASCGYLETVLVNFAKTMQTCQPSRFWRDSPAFFYQMSRVPLNHGNAPLFVRSRIFLRAQFVTLPRCPDINANHPIERNRRFPRSMRSQGKRPGRVIFFPTLVPGSGNFQLSRLADLGYGLGLGFWVVITILVSLTLTLTLITTLTVILPYPQS